MCYIVSERDSLGSLSRELEVVDGFDFFYSMVVLQKAKG